MTVGPDTALGVLSANLDQTNSLLPSDRARFDSLRSPIAMQEPLAEAWLLRKWLHDSYFKDGVDYLDVLQQTGPDALFEADLGFSFLKVYQYTELLKNSDVERLAIRMLKDPPLGQDVVELLYPHFSILEIRDLCEAAGNPGIMDAEIEYYAGDRVAFYERPQPSSLGTWLLAKLADPLMKPPKFGLKNKKIDALLENYGLVPWLRAFEFFCEIAMWNTSEFWAKAAGSGLADRNFLRSPRLSEASQPPGIENVVLAVLSCQINEEGTLRLMPGERICGWWESAKMDSAGTEIVVAAPEWLSEPCLIQTISTRCADLVNYDVVYYNEGCMEVTCGKGTR